MDDCHELTRASETNRILTAGNSYHYDQQRIIGCVRILQRIDNPPVSDATVAVLSFQVPFLAKQRRRGPPNGVDLFDVIVLGNDSWRRL